MSVTMILVLKEQCFASIRHILISDLRMTECKLVLVGADKVGEMLYHNNSIMSIDLHK